jgi:glutaredoxin
MHIEIFYADICGLCHKAMDYFRSREIPFIPREVHWDGEADDFVTSDNSREMKDRCGDVDFVPQIFINGQHIPGWKKLEPMIESGEIETLLASS